MHVGERRRGGRGVSVVGGGGKGGGSVWVGEGGGGVGCTPRPTCNPLEGALFSN